MLIIMLIFKFHKENEDQRPESIDLISKQQQQDL